MSAGLTGFEARSSWRFLVLEGDEAGCRVINTTHRRRARLHHDLASSARNVLPLVCIYAYLSDVRGCNARHFSVIGEQPTGSPYGIASTRRHCRTVCFPPRFSDAFRVKMEMAEKFGRACKLYFDVIDASIMRDRCKYVVLQRERQNTSCLMRFYSRSANMMYGRIAGCNYCILYDDSIL